MANIDIYLNQILNALYGREVRRAIYESLKRTNNESTSLKNIFDSLIINAGNSNAEIVVSRTEADGTTYNTLKDRLDHMDIEIRGEEDTQIIDVNFTDKMLKLKLKNGDLLETGELLNATTVFSKDVYVVEDLIEANNIIRDTPEGSKIVFTSGTITEPIVLLPNRTYVGNGFGTVIKAKNNANITHMFKTEDNNNWKEHIIIKDLLLDGNKENNGAVNGIYGNTLLNCVFENVKIKNVKGTAFYINSEAASLSNTNHIINCRALGSGIHNIYIKGEDNHIIGGDFGMSLSHNIYMESPVSSIRNATVWACMENGIFIHELAENVQIWGCQIEGHAKHGIYINSSFNHIANNKIYDNSNIPSNYGQYCGIYIDGVGTYPINSTTIIGNKIFSGLYNNTAYHKFAIGTNGNEVNTFIQGNELRFNNVRAIDKTRPLISGFNNTDIIDYSHINTYVEASPSQAQTFNTTEKTIIYDRITVDKDGEMNNGIFTPFYDGYYTFNYSVTCQAAEDPFAVKCTLKINNAESKITYLNKIEKLYNGDYSYTCHLNAGDRVGIYLSTSKAADVTTETNSSFTRLTVKKA